MPLRTILGQSGSTTTSSLTFSGPINFDGTVTFVAGSSLVMNATTPVSGNIEYSGVVTFDQAWTTKAAQTWTQDQFFKTGRPWIDIRAYGAVGDGVTDDTTAIQNALNAAKSMGAIVWAPPGKYLIATGPLIIYDHTTFMGPLRVNGEWYAQTGLGAVLINNTTGDTLDFNNTGALASLNSSVTGLSFEGSSTGTFIKLGANVNNIVIADCSFVGRTTAIDTAGGYTLKILSNMMSGQSGTALLLSAGGTHVVVEKNYLRAGSSHAIASTGASGVTGLYIRDNIITGFTAASVNVLDFSTAAARIVAFEITNNDMEGNTGASAVGIALTNAGSGLIAGNSFSTIANGINLAGTTAQVFISHNSFPSISGTYAIQVGASCVQNIIGTNNGLSTALVSDSAADTTHLELGVPKNNQTKIVEARGSGSGVDYTTTSTSLVDVDATNLTITATIPTGYVGILEAVASIYNTVAANGINVALYDVTATSTLDQKRYHAVGNSLRSAAALRKRLAGDGTAHTYRLRYSGSANTTGIDNGDSTLAASMVLSITPSN